MKNPNPKSKHPLQTGVGKMSRLKKVVDNPVSSDKCYCVCHSPYSSRPSCEHCKGLYENGLSSELKPKTAQRTVVDVEHSEAFKAYNKILDRYRDDVELVHALASNTLEGQQAYFRNIKKIAIVDLDKLIASEVKLGKKEQIMQDFYSLVMGDVGDEVDELTLINWREDSLKELEELSKNNPNV